MIFIADTLTDAPPLFCCHDHIHVSQSHQVSDTDQDKEAAEECAKRDCKELRQRDRSKLEVFADAIGHKLLSACNAVCRLMSRTISSQWCSSFDDYLERFRFGGVPEGLIGFQDAVELEAMRNQELGVDLAKSDGFEQHRYSDRVDQPRGDGNIAVPKLFGILRFGLFSMDSDVGDGAAGRNNALTIESGRMRIASTATSTPRL